MNGVTILEGGWAELIIRDCVRERTHYICHKCKYIFFSHKIKLNEIIERVKNEKDNMHNTR